MLQLFFSFVLFIAAGGTLFGLLVNRVLLDRIRSGHGKLRTLLLILAALMVLSALGAVRFNGTRGILLPAVFLAVVGIDECRRLLIRRQCRASPPVEVKGPRASLFRPVTTFDLVLRRYVVQDLPALPHPIRVVFVSDLHAYDGLPSIYYDRVVERINEAEPDLLLLGGDFVKDPTFSHMLTGIFSRVSGRFGSFASMGNHDHWSDVRQISSALESAGITPIGNGWRRIPIGNGSIIISGCEEPWSPDRWQMPPSDGTPVIVISHTADNVYRLAKAGVGAVFSGHYHGGHFALPIYGSVVVPSRYGRRFDRGHFKVHGTHLFVSTGTGSVVPPFRFYSQPEVLVVDFR